MKIWDEKAGDKRDNKCLLDVIFPVVVALRDDLTVVFEGDWLTDVLPLTQAGTLFSFLDYKSVPQDSSDTPRKDEEKNATVLLNTQHALAIEINVKANSLVELLMLSQLQRGTAELDLLYFFLRKIESYWLSSFLLSQVVDNQNDCQVQRIRDVCKVYGVSESYFRLLCKHAFCNGPKKQLRLWRAANSVLQLIEKNRKISTIAGDNGYASSSHFSSEIKSLFGIKPKDFKVLESYLYE